MRPYISNVCAWFEQFRTHGFNPSTDFCFLLRWLFAQEKTYCNINNNGASHNMPCHTHQMQLEQPPHWLLQLLHIRTWQELKGGDTGGGGRGGREKMSQHKQITWNNTCIFSFCSEKEIHVFTANCVSFLWKKLHVSSANHNIFIQKILQRLLHNFTIIN